MRKSDSVIENTEKRQFKLSRLELRKSNSVLTDYLAFWSQFEKILLAPEIVDDDKF